MYKLLTMDSTDEWLKIVKSFKNHDVYYYPQYLKAYEDNGDGTPVLFYLESSYGRAANVFLKRDISNDKFFRKALEANKYFDISTVYGYGGPLYDTRCFELLTKKYNSVFSEYCRDNNVVSEFIRFHPLLANHNFFRKDYEVSNIRSTVYVDLRKGENYIWDNFKSENRTRIRKAIKSGLKVIFGREKYLIDEFRNLYHQTMDRDKASEYYYFNNNFFYTTLEELSANSFIAAIEYNGRIIAASIILFNEKYVHYHFGGSDKEYMYLAPNNLLFYEVAKWGCRTGRLFFHLGGGYSGDDDPLFRFKKSFSKNNVLPFYIGKKIQDENLYYKLINIKNNKFIAWDKENKYFPTYRG